MSFMMKSQLGSSPGDMPHPSQASTDPGLNPASGAHVPDAASPPGMYLSTLRLVNFRSCYDATIALRPTLTLLVGENNSGKSNVIEALRLATAPLSLRRTRYFGPTTCRTAGRPGPSRLGWNWRTSPPSSRPNT